MPSGGNSTSALDIGSGSISQDLFNMYDKKFKLNDAWKDIEYGGTVKKFQLLWWVKDNEGHRRMMSDLFDGGWDADGNPLTWRDKFIPMARPTGDGNTEDGWMLKAEYFDKMTGEQAVFMFQMFNVATAQEQPDCWGDMLVGVTLVIVLTLAGCPECAAALAGTATMTYMIMLTLLVMTISVYYIVTRQEMPRDMQYAMLAFSIYNIAHNWGKITGFQSTMAMVNVATTGLNMKEQDDFKDRLNEQNRKYQELKDQMEADAEKQRKIMRFVSNDYADYHIHKGCGADPMAGIKQSMDSISSYGPARHYKGHNRFYGIQTEVVV